MVVFLNKKLLLWLLILLVVGLMIGVGIFFLFVIFGCVIGGFGVFIVWVIVGGGMLILVFVFQILVQCKFEFDFGVYIYVKIGFGDYVGFVLVIGFWVGVCIGSVFYFVLIKLIFGVFFLLFGDGNILFVVLIVLFILWSFYFMVLCGIKEVVVINIIVIFVKVILIFIFIIVLVFVFYIDIFVLNFWGIQFLGVVGDFIYLDDYGYIGYVVLEIGLGFEFLFF